MPIEVLLVEDNPADIQVMRTALPHLGYELRLQVVTDGQAALDYLSGKSLYHDRSTFPLPDLILLDLSLPRVHGFHVLEWVRTEPFLKQTPIVILATSSYSGDIKRAYQFGANSFITKPIAEELGIEHLVATDIEEVAGRFTGRPRGTPCFREGKVTRVTEWLSSLGSELGDYESWFYSDSLNDVPLLERVDHAVAVDPDPTLRAYARERGWDIISLK